ncbi:phosphate ABC transporter ATP-binding protein PstB [Phenylobacterium sp. CCH12-B4]|uniref:phosphate ABC transporter ATP-binding protein PstB n=1 Tax=Phenylobacterium sp. CCH12-B4 TaxID=1768784 RepID=UPI00083A5929|nr:phosphate ABC transporter ATP-binding protein PstB [Phenylobacterium sp. CCH12-B4]
MNETLHIASPAVTTTPPLSPEATIRARVSNLDFWYGKFQALHSVSMPIQNNKVTAIIGPSGCGKSTLLRCFNRIHDLYPGARYEGAIELMPDGLNLVSRSVDPILVRLMVGMVFQKPNPFPKSIFENVASGLYVRGIRNRSEVEDRVEKALKQAAIWDEVQDRLKKPAYELSGGQQQRLCIARALAPEPKLLLLDEPTSALDPIATAKIESLLADLAHDVTVVIVTHNMGQAARISDQTAFMHMGKLIEFGETEQIFTNPTVDQTRDYITGRFG